MSYIVYNYTTIQPQSSPILVHEPCMQVDIVTEAVVSRSILICIAIIIKVIFIYNYSSYNYISAQ